MAKTFLEAVNDVLKRAKLIEGDAGELTSFTSSPLQPDIDHARKLINELIQELYSLSPTSFSKQTDTDSLTLVTDQRDYCLPGNLERIRWPLIDETNGQIISEYPVRNEASPFEQLRYDQFKPADFTGLPRLAAINPTTGELRMDSIPTVDDNGNVYQLLYDKRLELTITTDTFPFSDTAVDALASAASETWEITRRNDSNIALLRPALGRVMRHVRQRPPRRQW